MTDDRDFKDFVRGQAQLHGDSYQRVHQQFRRQPVTLPPDVAAILADHDRLGSAASDAVGGTADRVRAFALRLVDGKASVASYSVPQDLSALRQQVLDAEFHADYADPGEAARHTAERLRSDYEQQMAEYRAQHPERTAADVIADLARRNRTVVLVALQGCIDLLALSPTDDVAGRAVALLVDAYKLCSDPQ